MAERVPLDEVEVDWSKAQLMRPIATKRPGTALYEVVAIPRYDAFRVRRKGASYKRGHVEAGRVVAETLELVPEEPPASLGRPKGLS